MHGRNFVHPRGSFSKQTDTYNGPCSKIAPRTQTPLLPDRRKEPTQLRQSPRDFILNILRKEQSQLCSNNLITRTVRRRPPLRPVRARTATGSLTPRSLPSSHPAGCHGTPHQPADGAGYHGAISGKLTAVMGFKDTNGSYSLKTTLIMQPGRFWKIQLCVQGGKKKKYRFIAQILLIAFLSRKTIPLLSNPVTRSQRQTEHCHRSALGALVSDTQADPGWAGGEQRWWQRHPRWEQQAKMDSYSPFCSQALWQGPWQPALPATSPHFTACGRSRSEGASAEQLHQVRKAVSYKSP